MEVPEDLKYTKEHEWVKIEGDLVRVGITEFAQGELGEIVFVELPEADQQVEQSQPFCVVESTKAASDVYAPVSGVVVEANAELSDSPQLINESPFEKGWLVTLKDFDEDEVEKLMDAAQYESYINNS